MNSVCLHQASFERTMASQQAMQIEVQPKRAQTPGQGLYSVAITAVIKEVIWLLSDQSGKLYV